MTTPVTKDDLDAAVNVVRRELHDRTQELRGELHDRTQELRGETQALRGETQALRGETQALRGDMQELRGELRDTEARLRGELHDTEARLRGDLRGEMRGIEQNLLRSIAEASEHTARVVEERLGLQLARHVLASEERNRELLRSLDDRYRAVPADVAALRRDLDAHVADDVRHGGAPPSVPPDPEV
jgi:chromosome segregation ATPase